MEPALGHRSKIERSKNSLQSSSFITQKAFRSYLSLYLLWTFLELVSIYTVQKVGRTAKKLLFKVACICLHVGTCM